MQRKRIGRGLVFLAVVLSLPGCGGCGKTTGPTPTAPRFAGVALRVACPAGAAELLVKERGPASASQNGWSVEVIRYDRSGNPPAADVWVIRAAEMPRWASAGQLTAVPEAMTARDAANKYEWSKLHDLYRDKLLLWNSTAHAVPLLGESPLCFYRTDLLDDPVHREDYRKQTGKPLEPPETWSDFAQIAKFFNGRKAAGLDGPSLPSLPARDEDLDRLFYQVAAPLVRRASYDAPGDKARDTDLFSFHCDLTNGEPRLEEAGFLEALALLQRMQAFRPKGTAEEPEETFAAGKAVLCLGDAPWVHRFQKGIVKDRFGVCRVPGSDVVMDSKGESRTVSGGNHVPYVGAAGWVAVVPAGASNPAAAWELLAELTGPANSRQIVIDPRWGGGAFRSDHGERPGDWSGFGLDAMQTKALSMALRQTLAAPGLRNPLVRLRIPEERSHREALAAEVRTALAEGAEARKTLSAVAQRWRELDRMRGPAHLADYYRSLGLEPPR